MVPRSGGLQRPHAGELRARRPLAHRRLPAPHRRAPGRGGGPGARRAPGSRAAGGGRGVGLLARQPARHLGGGAGVLPLRLHALLGSGAAPPRGGREPGGVVLRGLLGGLPAPGHVLAIAGPGQRHAAGGVRGPLPGGEARGADGPGAQHQGWAGSAQAHPAARAWPVFAGRSVQQLACRHQQRPPALGLAGCTSKGLGRDPPYGRFLKLCWPRELVSV
mmetsp:Transcript_143566/g.348659  ORF Transcript_143566/g.348659 Transcript_143566/m.348659 type:complete len:219 (-) Transcript_143566:114-770(-)